MSSAGIRLLRVGVDVGGTFTKAVAVEPDTGALRAQAVSPTTHGAPDGVSEGVVEAIRGLLDELGDERSAVQLVAFSTTQAMNALLEGDVPRTGIVGIGVAPDLRRARKRTRVGDIELAPGRSLRTEHEFLDATRPLDPELVDAALARLVRLGCSAVAVSAAFSVDEPHAEEFVLERAAAHRLPACAGHELSGAYGLETRTVSSAINASILPVVERTATMVERALREAGLDVPLLVLRGDGGAMSMETFRRRPSLTVGSGPAAGVAAAVHELGLRDGIMIECGGTSTNVSVVRGGRPLLRTLNIMGRPTSIRAIDSWVVGAGGGSLARLGRRGVAEVGPRSAHFARLAYACFARPEELRAARLVLVAPREGDPETYAVIDAAGGRFAITASCAANALGLVPPGRHAHGSRDAALAALEPLAAALRSTTTAAAERVLEAAVEKIARAVADAARRHGLSEEVPLVALGGAAEALVPRVAERTGRLLLRPEHPEVLSSIGAALALVRAEVVRSDTDRRSPQQVAREAEIACVASGAAPASVVVEASYEQKERVLRAVATGAVALETGALRRKNVPEHRQLAAASAVLGLDGADLTLLASTDFYRVFSENGSGRVAVVDSRGCIALQERAKRVFAGEGDDFLERLRTAIDQTSTKLGVAELLPRVSIVCGPRILDLSDARYAEGIVAAAARVQAEHPGTSVAVLAG